MRHIKNLQGFANSTRDFMPDAVNWTTVSQDDFTGTYGYTSRRITGINEAITIGVSYDSGYGDLYYGKNVGYSNGNDYSRAKIPSAAGLNLITNGSTFAASPLDYIDFGVYGAGSLLTDWAVIVNKSDVNKILDKITVSYLG